MKRCAPAGLVALALLVAPAAASAQVELVSPEVSGFSLTPRVFTVGPQQGTTMSYTLSEDATVYVATIRLRPGLLSEGDCLPVTTEAGRRVRGRRPARRCTAHTLIKIFTRNGLTGANSFRFAGRVAGRAVRPGRFRLAMNAIDAAGNTSPARSARFRIAPRRR